MHLFTLVYVCVIITSAGLCVGCFQVKWFQEYNWAFHVVWDDFLHNNWHIFRSKLYFVIRRYQ